MTEQVKTETCIDCNESTDEYESNDCPICKTLVHPWCGVEIETPMNWSGETVHATCFSNEARFYGLRASQ